MSRSTRTCKNCFRMISKPDLLAKACSSTGLDVIQTVEDFLVALDLGCYICQTIRDDCERNREYRPNEAFCLLEEGVPLIKNVKCRKSDNDEDPVTGVRLPEDQDFDAMLMRTTDSPDNIYFDVEALDGMMIHRFKDEV